MLCCRWLCSTWRLVRTPLPNPFQSPQHKKSYVMTFAFVFDDEEESYQFAYAYPYTYTRLQKYLSGLEAKR